MSSISEKNSKNKNDLILLACCAALYVFVQGLIEFDVIGPFWQLNIVLICINIILVT
ncbi:hypothetical protein Ga0466249_004263, partial [Sporomusaceae bacterium BoRhaA]|nr:hypothetical protein [Pelorhabdus rhamnosifermentans]